MTEKKCRRIACHERLEHWTDGVLIFVHCREMETSGDRMLFCSPKCAKIWIGANL